MAQFSMKFISSFFRLQCDELAREMACALSKLKLGSDADTLKHYQDLASKKQQVEGKLQEFTERLLADRFHDY